MKTEQQNLSKLPVKELAKKIICDGHLYLFSGERKFYLMKPGVFVDPSFIKKHAIKDQIFDFDSVINVELKERFKSLFKELHYLQFEKDLKLKCLEILNEFHHHYSSGEHFLTFALACHEEFCQVTFDDQRKMHEVDMHLFRKALYSSAFSIILGMTNDFFNFLMLRDFYNVTFTLDIGLCEDRYSYYVAEACNAENKAPGQGIHYLNDEKASESEKEVFLKHPERSYKLLKEQSLLTHPELSEISLYQHELADGSGFPRGIAKGQVSSWEAIVIFSDSLVEITPDYTFEKDVITYLSDFRNPKLKDLPVNRVFKKMCMAFEYFAHKKTGA